MLHSTATGWQKGLEKFPSRSQSSTILPLHLEKQLYPVFVDAPIRQFDGQGQEKGQHNLYSKRQYSPPGMPVHVPVDRQAVQS